MRPSGRNFDSLRSVSIETGFSHHAEGSALIKMGGTEVLCTASVEGKVPGFMRGQGEGWVTAEYGMLPRATHTRGDREAARGKQSGRTQEIQRLIGRSLRAVVDRKLMGEISITLDCDVLNADGGTRCASITGAYVALSLALKKLQANNVIKTNPLIGQVAAISCGIYQGTPVLDLDYAEDSAADADANFILTQGGGIIEIQATAEKATFDDAAFAALLALARAGTAKLFAAQNAAFGLKPRCGGFAPAPRPPKLFAREVSAVTAEAPSLQDRIASIRALARKGATEEAQKAGNELANYPTQTPDEVQEISNLLADLNLRGGAELVIVSHLRRHPEDRQTQVLYLYKRAAYAHKIEDLDVFLAGFVPETLDEHIRLAKALTYNSVRGPALEMCRRSLKKFPDNHELLFCYIEILNRLRNYADAIREITKFAKLLPPTAGCASFAFLAEQCAIAGDAKLFAEYAQKTEALLGGSNHPSRLVLIRGYDRLKDGDSIERLLTGIDYQKIPTIKLLTDLFHMCGKYWLNRPQLAIARRMLEIGFRDVALKEICERTVQKYGAADEAALSRKSLFL